MKIDPQGSLKTTFLGLFFIWLCGGGGLLLITGNPFFAVMYMMAMGPVLLVIYHTAKASVNNDLTYKKEGQEEQASQEQE